MRIETNDNGTAAALIPESCRVIDRDDVYPTSHRSADGGVILFALDLAHKFGFEDGDLLARPIADLGFDDLQGVGEIPEYCDEGEALFRAVLKSAVRRYLEPRLPGLPIDYEASLIHNPVRLNSGKVHDPTLAHETLMESIMGVAVHITGDQLRELVGLELEAEVSRIAVVRLRQRR